MERRLAEYFYILSKSERVLIVSAIEKHGELSIGALSEHIAETELKSAEAIEVSLRHTHLPKLDDSDVVEYDAEADAVAATEKTGAVASLIEAGDEIVS